MFQISIIVPYLYQLSICECTMMNKFPGIFSTPYKQPVWHQPLLCVKMNIFYNFFSQLEVENSMSLLLFICHASSLTYLLSSANFPPIGCMNPASLLSMKVSHNLLYRNAGKYGCGARLHESCACRGAIHPTWPTYVLAYLYIQRYLLLLHQRSCRASPTLSHP